MSTTTRASLADLRVLMQAAADKHPTPAPKPPAPQGQPAHHVLNGDARQERRTLKMPTKKRTIIVSPSNAPASSAQRGPRTGHARPNPGQQAAKPKVPPPLYRPVLPPGRAMVADTKHLSGKWIVLRLKDGRLLAGTVAHEAEATARKEAHRLAGKNPGEVFIACQLGAAAKVDANSGPQSPAKAVPATTPLPEGRSAIPG